LAAQVFQVIKFYDDDDDDDDDHDDNVGKNGVSNRHGTVYESHSNNCINTSNPLATETLTLAHPIYYLT
jgi:hypothetical protein